MDKELAEERLDFRLKIGNEYCWSVHKETFTTKSSFFDDAISQFEVGLRGSQRTGLTSTGHHS